MDVGYNTGWTNSTDRYFYFNNLIMEDIVPSILSVLGLSTGAEGSITSDALSEYQKISFSADVPIAGDTLVYLIREYLVLKGVNLYMGLEGYTGIGVYRFFSDPITNFDNLDPNYNLFFGTKIYLRSIGIPFSVTPAMLFNSRDGFKPGFCFYFAGSY